MYRMQLEKDLYENPDNTAYQLCNTPEAMESDSDVCLDMESDDLYTKSPCTSQSGRDLCENADKYGDLIQKVHAHPRMGVMCQLIMLC